jgi:hypothetical protein
MTATCDCWFTMVPKASNWPSGEMRGQNAVEGPPKQVATQAAGAGAR